MKFINLNKQKNSSRTSYINLWNNWNKHYCQNINNQITSLFDYIAWHCPEHIILNSPIKLSEKSNFKPYESLCDTEEEPRLLEPYEEVVDISYHIKSLDTKGNIELKTITEKRSLFFPAKLNYNQGFYNQSKYGDGLLCTPWFKDSYCFSLSKNPLNGKRTFLWCESGLSSPIYEEKLSEQEWKSLVIIYYSMGEYELLSLESVLDWRYDDSSSLYIVSLQQSWIDKLNHFNYLLGIVGATDIEYSLEQGYTTQAYNKKTLSLHPTTVVLNKPFIYWTDTLDYSVTFYGKQGEDWIQLSNDDLWTYAKDFCLCAPKGDFQQIIVVDSRLSIDLQINFFAGYMCMLNKQPTGINSDQNPIKQDLNNYLIIPVGNGGYYEFYWDKTDLVATYNNNILQSFINKVSVNLAQHCRYYNRQMLRYSIGENDTIHIPNINFTYEDSIPWITDQYNNVWSGAENLIGIPILYSPTTDNQKYCCGEQVMMDVKYSTYSTQERHQKIYYFVSDLEKTIDFKNIRLFLY